MSSAVSIQIDCFAPAKVCAPDEAAFQAMVVAAREVTPATLPTLYKNAEALAFARSGGVLVGVGALKHPFDSHRESVFRHARSNLSPASFAYELGWFHVIESFQGKHISSRMVQVLMPWAAGGSVYATSRVNNERMHHALIRHGGFVKEGGDFASTLGDVPLRLFIRR